MSKKGSATAVCKFTTFLGGFDQGLLGVLCGPASVEVGLGGHSTATIGFMREWLYSLLRGTLNPKPLNP